MDQPLDSIKYAADQALSVPNVLQLRPYTITIKTITWTGETVGEGTSTTTSQVITNANNINVRFRQVDKRDIALSGGILKDQDVKIGPIVFPYSITGVGSGGTDPTVFSPTSNNVSEVYINITGPNMPSNGSNYKKIYDTTERNVLYRVFLRNTAAQLP